MKKQYRRITAVLLAVVMIVMMFGTVTINASIVSDVSVGATQAEAVNWVNSKIGTWIGSGQCVALINAYANYLGLTISGGDGNACDYTGVTNISGTTRINNYSGFVPQSGDICVWGSYAWLHQGYQTNYYGHIGIVLSADASNMITVECNLDYPYEGGVCKKVAQNRPTAYVTCFIRPKFKPQENPVSGAWVKAAKRRLPVGDSNTITFGANNANRYNIRVDKDGALWKYQEGVSSGLSYTFSDPGEYSVFIAGHNSISFQDSSKAYFTVYSTLNLGSDFKAKITHVKSGKRVSAYSDENVILHSIDGTDYQEWHFTRNSDSTYTITNCKLNKCLDVYGGATANGTNVQVYNANGSNAQKWYIVQNTYGFSLAPKNCPSSVLDIYNGETTDGTNIHQHQWNGSGAQIFTIDYLSLTPTETLEYNGHRYEFYNNYSTWYQAYRTCEKLGGHLVTITSQAENNKMLELTNGFTGSVWIGARRGDWYWVNCEPYVENNFWASGEPNNTGGKEEVAHLYISGSSKGKWNDINGYSTSVEGFICEYDDVTNSDNYIPCQTITVNGYTYDLYDYNVDWQTAKKICEIKGGMLSDIKDSSEQELVWGLVKKGAKSEYWIGLTDIEDENNWKWTSGATSSYRNWMSDEPNNDTGIEEYIAIGKSTGEWYDLKGCASNYRSVGFICKTKLYEAGDTNLDGVIDINDVTSIQRFLARLDSFTDKQLALADTNGDGDVDIMDATYIQKYLAGYDVVLGKQ